MGKVKKHILKQFEVYLSDQDRSKAMVKFCEEVEAFLAAC